jgi:MFS family permease
MARVESSMGALGAIICGALILQVANTIVHTVVPLWMATAGQPPIMIGAVGSAYSVGFLVGCFFAPVLVRRIGHIRGFAVFASLQAAATIAFALIPESAWILPRLAMGACGAGLGVCIESWISGQAKGSHRGRVFGAYQILNRISLIGSQIGVGYVSLTTHDVFLYASIAFSMALIPVGLTRARGPETSKVVSVQLRSLWRQAPTGVVGCLYVGLMGGPLTSVAPAYGILIGLDQRGTILLTAAVQIGALLLQWPLGLLADRVSSRLIILVGTALTSLAAGALPTLIALGVPMTLPALAGLFALIGACSIPLYTVAVTHTYLRLGPEQAIGISAQLLFLWAVGSTIGPLLASTFMQAMGPQGLLIYVAALSAAVGCYVVLRIARKSAPPPDSERPATPPVLPEIGPRGD